jgi:hypothetical protein
LRKIIDALAVAEDRRHAGRAAALGFDAHLEDRRLKVGGREARASRADVDAHGLGRAIERPVELERHLVHAGRHAEGLTARSGADIRAVLADAHGPGRGAAVLRDATGDPPPGLRTTDLRGPRDIGRRSVGRRGERPHHRGAEQRDRWDDP